MLKMCQANKNQIEYDSYPFNENSIAWKCYSILKHIPLWSAGIGLSIIHLFNQSVYIEISVCENLILW